MSESELTPVPKKIKFKHDDDDNEELEVAKPQLNTGETVSEDTTEKQKKKKRKNKGMKAKMNRKAAKENKERQAREERIARGEPEKLPTPKQLASKYLKDWQVDRINWKFQKGRQLWVIRNVFDTDALSKEDFKIAVEYFEEMPTGNARTILLEKTKETVAKASISENSGVEQDFGEDEKEEIKIKTNKTTTEANLSQPDLKKRKRKLEIDSKKSAKIAQEVLKRAKKMLKALQRK
ncbi:hypothetical protein HK100_008552 [Physocladia obscura]|uniref:WKF domain-containing protein n=1 Tax=Physocladia obscura TaxID=109957 RepID=A0AAD5SQJ4_9FUNG|nr:hypothetical protein HK100_008552 [Physocladia obscura]